MVQKIKFIIKLLNENSIFYLFVISLLYVLIEYMVVVLVVVMVVATDWAVVLCWILSLWFVDGFLIAGNL